MASNELFRMVSLRQSKSSSGSGAERRDPRLRHGSRLDAQKTVEATPQTVRLQDLKLRQTALLKKYAQLEALQRLVVGEYLKEVDAPPTGEATAARAGAARARTRPLAESARRTGLELRPLTQKIKTRLDASALEIFKEGLGSITGDTRADISDLVNALSTADTGGELNLLCQQIHEIEATGTLLPTVPASTGAASAPYVAAVGWGDLVLARETLVGYDAREIAHIENILPGETKLREHERIAKTEEVQESETTTEKETEKDSQSTDRYELQAQSQAAISENFSISTGLNVSGKYGLTQVDTSLDAAFSRSESSSRSNSINTAREVVSKAVDRTFERVRKLRRLTLTEQIREFNRHRLSNAGTSPTPAAISGMYLFVEKIQRVELRHYGTRMMVEFHIPEPALSLLERTASPQRARTLPPFNLSPGNIHPGNYLCEAQRYGATGVTPPPPLFIQVGWGWNSKMSEDANQWDEDAFNDIVNIPTGYRPMSAKVAWSGLKGKQENREFNFSFAVGGRSQANYEHTVLTYDGVELTLRADTDWPQGVPVTGRVHGAWDGAMYVHVNITCMRTAEALDAWRLRTWEALRAGYEGLERKFGQQNQEREYQQGLISAFSGTSTAAEYRRIEKNELQKWAIKCMRRVPQNFNAIEQVGDTQEVNAESCEAQAPMVRFYEDSFEWEHMSYFLYPYHWSRRATWKLRESLTSPDAQHRAFLEAGAARLIVPVTPGYEDKVAWFLDPSNNASTELERVLAPSPTSPPPANDPFRDLWIELLTEHRNELAKGSGTLKVTQGHRQVSINADSHWKLRPARDTGREVYIAGDHYEISAVVNETTFELDRPFVADNDEAAAYVAGSTAFGPPWTVNVPTSLIVLADNVAALKAI